RLQRLRNHRGHASVLSSNSFYRRIFRQISCQHWHCKRAVGVGFGGNLDVVDLDAGFFERVLETFVGLATLGRAEQSVDQRLVTRLQTGLEHLGRRDRAARVQVDTSVTGAFRAVRLLNLG